MKKGILLLTLSFLFTGCGSPSIQFQGKTASDNAIKRDTITNIKYLTRVNGCNKLDSVKTSIVSYDAKKHISKEVWNVYGCGKQFDFDIRYQADPKGGTFIGVSKKK